MGSICSADKLVKGGTWGTIAYLGRWYQHAGMQKERYSACHTLPMEFAAGC